MGAKIERRTEKEILKKETKNQIRLAEIGERLKKHQEAYNLCSKMLFNIHKTNINEYAIEAQDWWHGNCLYLDDKSRNAFREAFLQAPLFQEVFNDDKAKAEKIFEDIKNARDLIVKGVSLNPEENEHKSINRGLIEN